MKKYIFLMLAVLLSSGCQRSGLQQSGSGAQPTGEMIEVALSLPLEHSQAISRAAATTSLWSGGGLDAQITTTPLDQSSSKAIDESLIANVWVLQFDGVANDSKLIYKNYVASYTTGSKVQLIRIASTNRVAIVANTFDASWADGFEPGTTTWETVSTKSKAVAAQGDVLRSSAGTDYLPMSGKVDLAQLAVGATLKIPLTRTVVKVVVRLQSHKVLGATKMDVKMCNIPNATSWFPNTESLVWPATVTPIEYPLETVTGFSPDTPNTVVERTFWLPVNRRGTVADTEPFTRFTKAPNNATYLYVLTQGWVYKIHLGKDFETDYNLNPNTIYTYLLTFKPDPGMVDSRVANEYFGSLVQDPSGAVGAAGGTIVISSPEAKQGATWWAGLSKDAASVGFTLGTLTGEGPTAKVPVYVSLNPTNRSRSTTFTATGANDWINSLTLEQDPATLTYDSPSILTPIYATDTKVTFTVTGTAGLKLQLRKTGGEDIYSKPNPETLTCDGTAQTVTVTITAGNAPNFVRQAYYSATVTNAGALGLDHKNIIVKQEGLCYLIPLPGYPTTYVMMRNLPDVLNHQDAIAQCTALGGRLPTKDELVAIYNNKSGYGTFESENYSYWSSTPSSDGSGHLTVEFDLGSVSDESDDQLHFVRCVKYIP